MSLIRLTRKGQKLVGNTLYVPQEADERYRKQAKKAKASKSSLMVQAIVKGKP